MNALNKRHLQRMPAAGPAAGQQQRDLIIGGLTSRNYSC